MTENQTPASLSGMSDAGRQAMALVEEKDGELRVRGFGPAWTRIVSIIAVIWALFQLYETGLAGLFSRFLPFMPDAMDAVRLRVYHILFLLLLSFLMYPAFRREKRARAAPSAFDFLCVATGFFAFIYFLIQYEAITMRGGFFLPPDRVAASAGVVIAFVMAWRVVGNLAWLAAVFLAYCFLGQYIPGAFGHTGFSWNRVMEHMFWGTQGILGVGVGVSATYIFLFVLFGSFLKYSGFSSFINDLSLTLVGGTAGGPAKVAVIASALMGMINGSALANVATTGAITIPLMKRTGYRAEFAGAVEAVASTGGQFAPPIMGAVGFIMAEFLGVPYTTVMLAAAIPAFLYYLALLMAVHFEARKMGLKGLSRENVPDAVKVLRSRGHLIIPLAVLMIVLFMGYTPLFAATLSIVSTVLASWLSRETRMSFKTIITALDEGARGAVGVGAACVIIGAIIGTVSLTGLGLTFGYEVLKYVKEGQLYIGGLLVMLMSVVLGMGVPGVAAYVIVAAVAVPVLTGVGVQPLAAHMFCLFYACLSNITPPVAMSSYVAAGIARSDQTKTSLIAVRLGLAGFILPFFFLDNPLLLYDPSRSIAITVWALISASLGVAALAAGLEGWLWGPCNIPMRLMLLATAGLAIDPNLMTDAAGFALFCIALFWSRRNSRKNATCNPIQETPTMKRILSLCFALLVIAATASPASAAKTNISFPTAATTGALYPLGAGIANLWNATLDNVNARVQASNGGIQNLNLLMSKDAQVSFAVSSITYEALHGMRGFKDRAYKDVRILAGLYYNPNQVVARSESGVNVLADFKGKRFAPGAAGGTTEVESRIHFTAAGLKYPDDIKAQFVGFTESIDLMRNKQLDGAWIMAGLPTAAVTEMCATAGGKLVSMDEALIRKLQAEFPWYSEFMIPAGTYDNQKEPVRTTAVKMLLLTDASMPEDLVYSLVKTFWENLEELGRAHAVMKTVSKEMAVKDLSGIPLHPGAEKYYREAGLLK